MGDLTVKISATMERDEENENIDQLMTFNKNCESLLWMSNKDGVIPKKKRSARNYSNIKESAKPLISDAKVSNKIDKKNAEQQVECLKKFDSFWFNLSPQKGRKAHTYPELARPYINLRNTDLSMPVSFLHKYLMVKLNLESENEIVICCLNEPLSKNTTLNTIYQMWIQSMSESSGSDDTYPYPIGANMEMLIMQLTYRKNMKD